MKEIIDSDGIEIYVIDLEKILFDDKSTVPLEIKEAPSKIRNRANSFEFGLLQLMSDCSAE